MNYDNLLKYIVAVAIIVAIPGPNIILVMNNSIKHGVKNGFLTILGIKLGMLLLFTISLSSIATILILFSSLFIIIKWTGVFYLIYLGITQIIYSNKNNEEKEKISFENKCFVKGFMISVTNPKGLIFAGAFFPQFITEQKPIVIQSIILCSSFILISFLIEVIYIYFSRIISKLLNTDHMQKLLDRISGLIFIFLGVGLSFYKRSN